MPRKPNPKPEPESEAPQDARDPSAVASLALSTGRESEASGAQEDDDGQVVALRREAADRRRQLREVEAERDQLRDRLDTHDRAEVEALATGHMADGRDLWLSTELDDLRGDDGLIDAGKVEERVTALLEERPHWRKADPDPDTHAGARQTATEPPRSPFGKALKGLRGGG